MKDNSIIKDLYDLFDEVNFGFWPSGAYYERKSMLREAAYEKMMGAMPEDIRKMYDEYEELDSSIELMHEKEIYRQGVCFGVKLTAEAFIINKNRANSNGD